MTTQDLKAAENDLQQLESRVEELVVTVTKLTEENKALRNSQEKLVGERAELIEKTELAKSRVEAMINRLKALEIQS
jgi:cell division protein ZapB